MISDMRLQKPMENYLLVDEHAILWEKTLNFPCGVTKIPLTALLMKNIYIIKFFNSLTIDSTRSTVVAGGISGFASTSNNSPSPRI